MIESDQEEEPMTTAEERDRETFKERLKTRLDAAGVSQSAMEERIGAPTGSFTRIFGGRKSLTWEILRDTSEQLGIDPSELVDGTGLAALIPAPAEPMKAPSPKTAEIALEAEISGTSGIESEEEGPVDEPTEPTGGKARKKRHIPGKVAAAVAAGAAAVAAILIKKKG